jgi:hypothetical protein
MNEHERNLVELGMHELDRLQKNLIELQQMFVLIQDRVRTFQELLAEERKKYADNE